MTISQVNEILLVGILVGLVRPGMGYSGDDGRSAITMIAWIIGIAIHVFVFAICFVCCRKRCGKNQGGVILAPPGQAPGQPQNFVAGAPYPPPVGATYAYPGAVPPPMTTQYGPGPAAPMPDPEIAKYSDPPPAYDSVVKNEVESGSTRQL